MREKKIIIHGRLLHHTLHYRQSVTLSKSFFFFFLQSLPSHPTLFFYWNILKWGFKKCTVLRWSSIQQQLGIMYALAGGQSWSGGEQWGERNANGQAFLSEPDSQADRQTGRQTARKTDRQEDSKANRQTDRQADRQTFIHHSIRHGSAGSDKRVKKKKKKAKNDCSRLFIWARENVDSAFS